MYASKPDRSLGCCISSMKLTVKVDVCMLQWIEVWCVSSFDFFCKDKHRGSIRPKTRKFNDNHKWGTEESKRIQRFHWTVYRWKWVSWTCWDLVYSCKLCHTWYMWKGILNIGLQQKSWNMFRVWLDSWIITKIVYKSSRDHINLSSR